MIDSQSSGDLATSPQHAARAEPPGWWAVLVPVAVVTVLAAYDLAAGPDVVLIGLLAVGPCLAAAVGSARSVAAVTGYVLALDLLLCWPDRLWWTREQALLGAGLVAVSAVSLAVAHHRGARERARVGAATEARDSGARGVAVVRSAPDCIMTTDADGRVLDFNPTAERVLGHRRADVAGRSLPDLLLRPAARPAYRAALAGAEPRNRSLLGLSREVPAVRADGTEFPAEVTVTRAELAGAPLFCWSLRDVTEQRRADVERTALEHRLRESERLESLGQLAGGIAHDFNNQLAVILNYAEFIATRTQDGADRVDAAHIVSAAERAAQLTRQLLIFSRQLPARNEMLDLNTVVADVQALLSRTLGEHVELEARAAETLPAIRGDRGHLEQILVNLAVNARDAMPEGGLLTIGTGVADFAADDPEVSPDLAPGRYVWLAVSDTGSGMEPAVLERAFEPFFTTKAPGDGAGSGLGLGLATVYGIVTKAGGGAEIVSEPGLGTTVQVYWPVVHAAARRADGTPGGSLVGRGERILVVEDDEAVREVVGRILSQYGYRVLDAADGHDALDLAGQQTCDMLLTDVVMPHMSGRELAEQLRRRQPGLPVLYMTGYANGLLGSLDELGDDVVVMQKPFNGRDLVDRVRAALAGRQVASAADGAGEGAGARRSPSAEPDGAGRGPR